VIFSKWAILPLLLFSSVDSYALGENDDPPSPDVGLTTEVVPTAKEFKIHDLVFEPQDVKVALMSTEPPSSKQIYQQTRPGHIVIDCQQTKYQ